VLNAVINNAFRFARSRVRLTCEVQEGYTVFSVIDDGEGYGPKMLSNPPHEPAEHSHRSTGLGLFFARRVAELHQHRERSGQVVLSNRGGGCFELWLP
jgi:signal transduction histidine kinase